jgi:hypothetical protein
VSKLWEYIAAYEPYFGVFFIVGGFMLCFFGHKLIGPSVCIIGLLTSVAVVCIVFYAVYFTSTTDPSQFWIWLGGGVVAGIILGIILMKY